MSKNSTNWLLLAAGIGVIAAARHRARQNRKVDFRGRTVLITGGSRGLGLVLARKFAMEGAKLALTSRSEEELERAAADLSIYTAPVLTLTCDVTKRDEVDAMVRKVMEHYGQIDVVVNNAGVIEVGPMETMTLEDYQEAMNVHFWAPLYVNMAVLPEMRSQKSGRIVNISSIGGKISVPHLLPYSASKHALVGLSEGMRSELIKDNIYVTTVCPGLMRTGSHVNAQFKGRNQLEYAMFSIGNALPFSSIDVDTAARQIVTACRYGDAELIISLPAQLGSLIYGVFPGAAADLFGFWNQFLPGPGGIGQKKVSGLESQTFISPSPLTALADQAVGLNNEFK